MGFRTTNLAVVVQALTQYGDTKEKQVRDVMAGSLERVYGRQQSLCAEDTGRMKRLTRHELSEDGKRYEMGFVATDFHTEGQDGYFAFVEFGTSKMVAQPSVRPAFFEEEPRLLNDLRRVYR